MDIENKSHSILIIDSDPIHNFLLNSGLSKLNIVLYFESNGLAGLNFLKEKIEKEEILPDLILVETNMPVMNGLEFLNEYKKFDDKVRKETSVILISALPQDKLKPAKGFEVAEEFLVKPIIKSKVLYLIEKYLPKTLQKE